MPGDSVRVVLLLFISQCALSSYGWSGGTRWASPELEALDERRDAQLLKAVVDSMAEWQRKHHSHRRKRAESSVCYDKVGCFRDSGPYGYIDMLPSPPEEVDTRFLVYSSQRQRSGDTPLLEVGFGNLSSAIHWASQAMDVKAPLKVIVHGFGSSCSHIWVYEMRSALMSVEECTVICVDWEAGAVFPNYVRAAANARLVGKQLSMLIGQLGVSLDKVHLIGFSLGAHVAGFTGAELKNISRITGLDPAGPLFESQDPRARLDSSDARFVDVIHSNGENLILGGLGSWQPMGHVDFYPNGGRMQKGCSNLLVGAVSDILWSAADVEGRSLCNHRRAYKFFTDSVSARCQFPAVPCKSYDRFLAGDCFPCPAGVNCSNMGYYSDKSKARGTLYLVTRDQEPFCAHQYLVEVENSPSALPVVSYGKLQIALIGDLELNETFTLTKKDDEELIVGGRLSLIVVPHPAVQSFSAVSLLYTAYAGWISSGLAKWSVDKVTLTDSHGKKISVCKKGLILESGVPVILKISPGDCSSPVSVENGTHISNMTKADLPVHALLQSVNGTRFIPTQVVHIGDEIFEKKNASDKSDQIPQATSGLKDSYLASWQPVLEYPDFSNSGNGLEPAQPYSEDSSGRGFRELHFEKNKTANETLVLGELVPVREANQTNTTKNIEKMTPVELALSLKKIIIQHDGKSKDSNEPPYKFFKVNEEEGSTKPEIREPILSSTTPKSMKTGESKWSPQLDLNPPSMGATESWRHWESSHPPGKKSKNLDFDKESTNSSSAPLVTNERSYQSLVVQFLPQRLVSFLEQAEKYARLAFAPFTSSDSGERTQRRLSFLPFSWMTGATRKDRKAEKDFKPEASEGSKVVIPYEYNIDRKPFSPKFIPLETKSGSGQPEKSVRTNLDRPAMLVDRMEEPVPAEDTEFQTASRKSKVGKLK